MSSVSPLNLENLQKMSLIKSIIKIIRFSKIFYESHRTRTQLRFCMCICSKYEVSVGKHDIAAEMTYAAVSELFQKNLEKYNQQVQLRPHPLQHLETSRGPETKTIRSGTKSCSKKKYFRPK